MQNAVAELKVSKFQNEFMKSSFLPKFEPNIVRISVLYCATLHKFILKFTDLYLDAEKK